jgi:hypothetical protein
VTSGASNSALDLEGLAAWERDCLADDPFAGDFGDGERILSDKMVTSRGVGECHDCAETPLPGTRNRVRVEAYGSEILRFRWCETCCRLMARAHVDEAAANELEARIGKALRARALQTEQS